MNKVLHAFYSKKQFNVIKKHKDKAYIYYLKDADVFVQITEIFSLNPEEEKPISYFDDAEYLGIVSQYYYSSKTALSNEELKKCR